MSPLRMCPREADGPGGKLIRLPRLPLLHRLPPNIPVSNKHRRPPRPEQPPLLLPMQILRPSVRRQCWELHRPQPQRPRAKAPLWHLRPMGAYPRLEPMPPPPARRAIRKCTCSISRPTATGNIPFSTLRVNKTTTTSITSSSKWYVLGNVSRWNQLPRSSLLPFLTMPSPLFSSPLLAAAPAVLRPGATSGCLRRCHASCSCPRARFGHSPATS
jgi:hypothetical protein